MHIEIWSDIVCPFCYIGKRRFEAALSEFEQKNSITIEYKSFQLNPNTITDTETSVYQNLANHKGISVEQAKNMSNQVTEMAREVGLEYNFDKAVVANTFNAHQMLHFAKSQNKQAETKEKLLQAYFIDGKNIDDLETLLDIGSKLNMDVENLKKALQTSAFHDAVRQDIYEAQQLRIQGVPFFVFDRKYGISGAQSKDAFLQTLNKSFDEWNKKQPLDTMNIQEGENCDVDGKCD